MKTQELKPFDKVLVRDIDTDVWDADIYSRYNENNSYCYCYVCSGGNAWKQCIPYEGNEHLLGTCEKPY